MNILVLNQDWFANEWRAAGHNVVSCGLSDHLDIVLPTAHFYFSNIMELAPSGFTPDVIVVHDNSGPLVIAGLEYVETPMIFFSVDTHHHHGVHSYLSHLFDYNFVAQKDYLPYYRQAESDAEWLPLWANLYMEKSNAKEYGAVFVGNLNPELNSERVWFFTELQKICPVKTMVGKYWEIFPFSEIVINQTVKGDLNFRVFEAMMSGAMLLTEETPNGLLDLFEPGRHLVTYTKGRPVEASEKIHHYLADVKTAREIGAAGREEILKNHTANHRAEKMLATIKSLKKRKSHRKFFGAMSNYATLGLRSEEIDTTVATKSYVSAMKCLDTALQQNETLDSQLACFVVFTCLKYEQYVKTGSGNEMLLKAREAFANEAVLNVATVRHYLNSGQFEAAKQLAVQISPEDAPVTFLRSENLVRMILDGQAFNI